MVSLGSWCLAGAHCPSMQNVIIHGASQHVEGLGARARERPVGTPPGSLPRMPPPSAQQGLRLRGTRALREGAAWGLPEPSPECQQSSPFLSRQPVVLGQEEVRLQVPMGPMQGRLGVCGD